MARITVRHANDAVREIEAGPARSLLNNLLLADIAIRHDCGGRSLCGTCRVRVLEGGAGLSLRGESEALRLAALEAEPQDRLACQTRAVRYADILVLDDGLHGKPGKTEEP